MGYSWLFSLLTQLPAAILGDLPPGFEIVEILTGEKLHSTPRINDCGEIVFSVGYTWHDSSEVFYFGDGALSQITNNAYSDAMPDVNNGGDIVCAV